MVSESLAGPTAATSQRCAVRLLWALSRTARPGALTARRWGLLWIGLKN